MVKGQIAALDSEVQGKVEAIPQLKMASDIANVATPLVLAALAAVLPAVWLWPFQPRSSDQAAGKAAAAAAKDAAAARPVAAEDAAAEGP